MEKQISQPLQAEFTKGLQTVEELFAVIRKFIDKNPEFSMEFTAFERSLCLDLSQDICFREGISSTPQLFYLATDDRVH